MSEVDPHDAPQALPDALETREEEIGAREVRRAVEEEFSAFYRESFKRLVGFLIHQGAAVADAADIAQETMVKAFRHWTEIRLPKAWVRKVATRELIRRALQDRDLDVASPEQLAFLRAPDAAKAWEDQQETLRLIRGLPPRQRQVMAWSFDGFDPSEIAEQLDISAEAVRSSLRLARMAIHEGRGDEERNP